MKHISKVLRMARAKGMSHGWRYTNMFIIIIVLPATLTFIHE